MLCLYGSINKMPSPRSLSCFPSVYMHCILDRGNASTERLPLWFDVGDPNGRTFQQNLKCSRLLDASLFTPMNNLLVFRHDIKLDALLFACVGCYVAGGLRFNFSRYRGFPSQNSIFLYIDKEKNSHGRPRFGVFSSRLQLIDSSNSHLLPRFE